MKAAHPPTSWQRPLHLKLGARYYNPTTGRFTQPDPSGQEANNYNYTSCNPVNRTDPSGLSWDCATGWVFFVGGFVGFGTGVMAAPLTAGQSFWLAFGGVEVIVSGINLIKGGCF